MQTAVTTEPQTNLQRFLAVYERNLIFDIQKSPDAYPYTIKQVPQAIALMAAHPTRISYMDLVADQTCEQLGVSCNAASLRDYLAS